MIAPIKTEAEYEAALSEIETLFNCAPDTPESDRLEVLTALVAAYENRHYPMSPPTPLAAAEYYWHKCKERVMYVLGYIAAVAFGALVGWLWRLNQDTIQLAANDWQEWDRVCDEVAGPATWVECDPALNPYPVMGSVSWNTDTVYPTDVLPGTLTDTID